MNESQALLVCLFSRAERAAEVRQALIEVFNAWRRGQLALIGQPGDLTRAQRQSINLRAWALASEEARTDFQRHKTRLLQEARDLLAAGRPIEALLESRKDSE